jgi:cytoskeletal protein CcmA (bactofilin family)
MAQSYTRQSTFADGDTITASLFNNEYNQLFNAFAYSSSSSATTGHRHDGSTGQGGNIPQIGDLDFNNKIVVDATNNRWGVYVEVSGSAVEQIRIQDGAIVPVTDNDIDLGTSSLEFKDLFLDGTAHVDTLDVDVNATVAGTLGVTGATTLSSDLSVGGNLTVTGSATIAGNLTFGDAASDTVAFSADVASNLLPSSDNTYDLGASGSEWKDLYIDGTANIDSLVADTADINGGTIDGATIATSDITVGSGKTLNVSAGTLTLADNQISGDKVEGGTIAATTITTLTSTTGNITSVNATTVDTTNLEVTTLKAKDGTAAGSIADSTGVVTLASSVLTTTDINGGTIDGVTIGGSSAGDITYANLSDGTITITAFVDEDDMSSDSATLVPTQQSVKAYVDAQVTAQDFDFSADTGGSLSIDLDSEAMTFTGGTGIDTSGSGNAVTFAIDSTVTTLTGSQTLTNKVLTSPDINTPDIDGGTIDGTVIGGSSAAAITGTVITGSSLDISGDADIDGTLEADAITVNGTALGEVIADTVGAMVSSNTETNITVTYEDSNNTLDFVIGTLNQDTTGNAATATALETARTIGGTSFDGTANIAVALSDTTTALATARTIGGVSFDGTADITPTTFTTATFSGDVNVDSGVLFVDVSENKVGINQASPDVSLDLGSNTDAVHVPVGTTAQRPGSAAAGYFRYNTSLSQFEGYTDSWGAIGGGGTNTFTHDVFTCDGSTTAFTLSQSTESENNLIVFVDGVFQEQSAYSIATSGGVTTLTMSAAPANGRKLVVYTVAAGVSGSNLNIDTMTGDGSDTTLTLSINPVNENNTQVFIDGVYQSKANYSISGTTLTFSTAPPTGSSVEVMTMTQTDINVPVDGTITSAKLSGDLVTPGALDVTGTVTADGLTVDGNATFTTADNTAQVALVSTDADASDGPILEMFRNSSSPADDDDLGIIKFFGENDASEKIEYGIIEVKAVDVSDGTEDGSINITAMLNGTARSRLFSNSTETVFNEGSQDLDFRVESDNNSHALFVQGSDGNVGIGTTSPSSTLHLSASAPIITLTDSDTGAVSSISASSGEGSLFIDADSGNAVSNTSMRFRTDGTERMRLDASGNLLVGKTSTTFSVVGVENRADGRITSTRSGNTNLLLNRLSSDGDIAQFYKDGTAVGSIGTSGGDLTIFSTASGHGGVRFAASGILPVDNSGALADNSEDIGQSDQRWKDLYLSGGVNAAQVNLADAGGTLRNVLDLDGSDNLKVGTGSSAGARAITFFTENTEQMRLDASGNLLVGKTAAGAANLGVDIQPSGILVASRSSNISGLFNRTTSDGAIVDFRKDNTTVGSIGSRGSTNLYIVFRTETAGDGCGLTGSAASLGAIIPSDGNGAAVDDHIDLGAVGTRWDDIYATNGTIQTSDRNEKQDIEALSEAEQRVAVAAKGLLRKFRWISSVQENGDDARIHFGIIAQDLQAAFEAEGLDAGRYAMFINSTWTDEETGEERSRMGVRYSELLAFIIAAI